MGLTKRQAQVGSLSGHSAHFWLLSVSKTAFKRCDKDSEEEEEEEESEEVTLVVLSEEWSSSFDMVSVMKV